MTLPRSTDGGLHARLLTRTTPSRHLQTEAIRSPGGADRPVFEQRRPHSCPLALRVESIATLLPSLARVGTDLAAVRNYTDEMAYSCSIVTSRARNRYLLDHPDGPIEMRHEWRDITGRRPAARRRYSVCRRYAVPIRRRWANRFRPSGIFMCRSICCCVSTRRQSTFSFNRTPRLSPPSTVAPVCRSITNPC